MQDLIPFERQLLLAELYHYTWYSAEAFEEFKTFLSKWELIMGKPILNKEDESTITSA